MPKALSFRGPFHEAGDVGDDELGARVAVRDHATAAIRAPDVDDAEMWHERGEGVVGDLRVGSGDARDERRLPGVRESHDCDVCHELELEAEPELLSHLPLLGKGRRSQAVGEESRIAVPASTASSCQEPVTCRD